MEPKMRTIAPAHNQIRAEVVTTYEQLLHAYAIRGICFMDDHGVVSLEIARELQKLNQCLRYEQIPDVGHGLPYDQPDRLAAVVRSFLQSVIAP